MIYINSVATLRVVYTVRSGCGSAWLERCVRDAEAGGSNPLTPTIFFVLWSPVLSAGLFLFMRVCGWKWTYCGDSSAEEIPDRERLLGRFSGVFRRSFRQILCFEKSPTFRFVILHNTLESNDLRKHTSDMTEKVGKISESLEILCRRLYVPPSSNFAVLRIKQALPASNKKSAMFETTWKWLAFALPKNSQTARQRESNIRLYGFRVLCWG